MDSQTHETKVRETTVRVKGREYPRFVVDFGAVDGNRVRKSFKSRAVAERTVATWTAQQKILAKKVGDGAKRFLDGDVQDAAAALQILGGAGTLTEAASTLQALRAAGLTAAAVQDAAAALATLCGKATLAEAATFYMERHFPEGGEITVDALVEAYIENRLRVDRRPDTIKDIRGRLGCALPRNIDRPGGGILRLKPSGFAHDFVGVPVAHVGTADLERWMQKHAGKARNTWRNARVHIVGLFNYAKARKYIRENPAEALETPRVSKSAKPRPYVMPVEDVQAALRWTEANEPAMVPYMALCMFAGIRPTECTRLDWKQINLDRREIDIRADVSKTGDERFVEIADNLVAWLAPHRKESGPVHFLRSSLRRIRVESDVRWENDVMRHSFGSYHLGLHENAGKTALQMGHREIDTTFEHYRRAVRKEDAERFWQIVPEGVNGEQ